MKNKHLLSCLCGGLMAFCLSFSSLACLSSGMDLDVSLWAVALGCGLLSAVAAVCQYFKGFRWVYLGCSLAFGVFLIFWTDFLSDAGAMAAHILDYYNRAYGIAIPDILTGLTANSFLTPLLAMGWVTVTLCCRTVCRSKGSILTLFATILPLAVCLVVTDTVPDSIWLFFLLLGLGLLVLTQVLRRKDSGQATKLTAILALPLAAVLGLLFLAIPRDSYETPDLYSIQSWFQSLLPYVEQTSDGDLVIGFNDPVEKRVSLGTLGSRKDRETPIMEVSGTYSGILYLRGQNFAEYDGKSWSAPKDITETFHLDSLWSSGSDTIQVRTYGIHNRLYLPYYPGDATLTDGMVKNEGREREYTLTARALKPHWQDTWQAMKFFSGGISGTYMPPGSFNADKLDPVYTQLPETTRQQALAYLEEHFRYTNTPASSIPSANTAYLAREIEALVSSCAEYDLNPGRMPGGADDFAMWFLEEAGKGYCVHFASAAVVLLRAAGIPARYVEGYTARVTADETTVIREKSAHAWAEYYVEDLGWVILDATPANPDDDDEPEETETQTPPTTKPTEPTEAPTEPTEVTAPATEPSGGGTAPSAPGKEDPPKADFHFPWGLILWPLAVFVLIWGQWFLRRRYILSRQHRGSTNARALARWQETARLCRLLKQAPPEDLRALAEKAKFSQHAIQPGELAQFTAAQRAAVAQMQGEAWYRRLAYRLIFAAY